jgi:hypothetical protein
LIPLCSSSHVQFSFACANFYENIVSNFNRISNKPFLMKLLKCNWRGCMTWHDDDDIVSRAGDVERGEFIALCLFFILLLFVAGVLLFDVRCYYGLLATLMDVIYIACLIHHSSEKMYGERVIEMNCRLHSSKGSSDKVRRNL